MIKIVELQGLQRLRIKLQSMKIQSVNERARRETFVEYCIFRKNAAALIDFRSKDAGLFEGGTLWIKFNAIFSKERHGACF